jgi:osmotically inducible lipoprotein OsmB
LKIHTVEEDNSAPDIHMLFGKAQLILFQKGDIMKKARSLIIPATVLSSLLALSGCSGMSTQQRNTAIGAGIGGVAGSVLTDGGTLGTLGGAAVGGVIGNQVDK